MDLFELCLVDGSYIDLEVRANDVKNKAFAHGDWIKKSIWNNLKVFRLRVKENYLLVLHKSLNWPIEAIESIIGLCYERLGPAQRNPCISDLSAKSCQKLHISLEQYIDKDCPSSKKNIEKMDRVPYASAVGELFGKV
ncbi:hypothetical protein Tco_1246417 [Tanacetum coccineum]